MASFEINYDNIRDVDRYLHIDDPDKYDAEIESVTEKLWDGMDEFQELLHPFFTTYLQSNLLRPLYIHHLALQQLQAEYKNIDIAASTIILDIVAKSLDIRLLPERGFHDEEFFLVRNYHFSMSDSLYRRRWKGMLIFFRDIYTELACRFRQVDVLHIDGGKLDKDLSRIPRAMSAFRVPRRKSKRLDCDVNAISDQVRKNISSMDVSIPHECILELVEKGVLRYLPDVMNRIGTLTEFIEKHDVKLVIASSVTHEDHLCLLAAARLSGIKSLIVPHGFSLAGNPFLDRYIDYQATLTSIERCYEGTEQYPLKASWFEREV